jgi:hypothetical protein
MMDNLPTDQVALLRQEVRELRNITEANAKATADLVEAWRTARGVVRFVKWMGSLATAVAALWALLQMAWAHR